ncbi:unnamed protein product [Tilletia laevis]|uniref:Uncharacterized protein n=2 Tax=Tilletia TaxID=13289 RepID=A0A177UHR1_9BASI|nr:hypothetical protein CF336_g3124 [Tilletia laevis]KAE8257646.1 hypothetical protein A4X03_0g4599 [Tilletia caries]CAD6971398.1 unnamed protein product [Tilletia controversa]KAE8197358.1 hypothetical protein CF335_g4634 [Tilletia laevis]CAD6888889.1 unnamed protein product [Tilletia caries]
MSARTITPFRAGQLKPDSAIYVVPAVTAIYGIIVHIVGIYFDPNSTVTTEYLPLNERQLSARAGIPSTWPAWFQGGDGKFTPKQAILILVAFWNDAMKERFAVGVMWIVICAMAPLILFFSIESMKTNRPAALGGATIFAGALFGNLGLAGFSFSSIVIPIYAWGRHREITQNIVNHKETTMKTGSRDAGRALIHPGPSPAPWKVQTAFTIVTTVVLIIASAAHTPSAYRTPALVANLAFWAYPVLLLPLLLPPFAGSKVSATNNPFARLPKGTRRTAAADAYATLATISLGIYFFALVLVAPDLYHKVMHARKMIASFGGYFGIPGTVYRLGFQEFCKLTFPVSYAAWSFVIDLSGLALAAYSIVFIDMVCDDWSMAAFSGRVPGYIRHTKKKYVLEDLIVGTWPTLILGPGYSLAKYFEKRERSAEAARNK